MLRQLERSVKFVVSLLLRTLFRSAPPAGFRFLSCERVLVIRQHNQLGDMLCAVPMLRSLRQTLPHARITLVASPVNHDIMRNCGYVDRVVNFDKGTGITALVRLIGTLRRERFQLAIVPSTVSTSFTSDMLAFVSGAAARIGAGSIDGVANPSGFFFNLPVELDWRATPHRHQALRNMDICAACSDAPDDLSSRVFLDEREKRAGKSFVEAARRSNETVIAFHPGAGKSPNRWPAGRFAELAGLLSAEYNAAVFITSGPMDADPVSAMISQLGVRYTLVENRPIRDVASILASTDLLIANDTGIMHVGAAAGTPVLSLFGPTDPEQWAPKGVLNRYIQGGDGRVGNITVQEVLETVREIMNDLGIPSRVIA